LKSRRFSFVHVVVPAVLAVVGLGIFQAAGALTTDTVATSKKFTGPEQPPSTWYTNGGVTINASDPLNLSGLIAKPAAGQGLVVQTIGYTSGPLASGTYAAMYVYEDSATDPAGVCNNAINPAPSFANDWESFDGAYMAGVTNLTRNIVPGIAVPAGDVLCGAGNGASYVVFFVNGYNVPASAVPHVNAPERPLPKLPKP
jgi:hypothetical protein